MGQHNILDQELIYFIHTTWYNFCLFGIIILCSVKYDCIWTWNLLRMLVFVHFSIEYTCTKVYFIIIILFDVCFALLSQTPVLEELFGNVHPLPTPFVVSASVLTWLIYYNTDISSLNQWVLTICMENRVIPGRIQMEQLIPMKLFLEKR